MGRGPKAINDHSNRTRRYAGWAMSRWSVGVGGGISPSTFWQARIARVPLPVALGIVGPLVRSRVTRRASAAGYGNAGRPAGCDAGPVRRTCVEWTDLRGLAPPDQAEAEQASDEQGEAGRLGDRSGRQLRHAETPPKSTVQSPLRHRPAVPETSRNSPLGTGAGRRRRRDRP